MAEVLRIVAEELGRALGLVWSGVNVALKLNNRVMSIILSTANKLVQLLLLLTNKVWYAIIY